jgi:hypothetical protein
MRKMPRTVSSSLALGLLEILCLASLLQSCSAAPGDSGSLGSSAGGSGASAGGGSSVAGGSGAPVINPLGRPRCQAPAGFSGSPKTTEDAVQLLNALPKPTSVACFVESLARPLTAFATSSSFSAQPALSLKSPRVFLKLDHLWISVVVDGDSSYLIEFGYRPESEPLRSVKGELQLPLTDVVPLSLPYDRVRFGSGTVCGLCHTGESPAANIPFTSAFASAAFRPRPDSHVSIETLKAESASCDWQIEPHRCELLSAIFDSGPVSEEAFPDDMPTFF